jgi:hypothetical protein
MIGANPLGHELKLFGGALSTADLLPVIFESNKLVAVNFGPNVDVDSGANTIFDVLGDVLFEGNLFGHELKFCDGALSTAGLVAVICESNTFVAVASRAKVAVDFEATTNFAAFVLSWANTFGDVLFGLNAFGEGVRAAAVVVAVRFESNDAVFVGANPFIPFGANTFGAGLFAVLVGANPFILFGTNTFGAVLSRPNASGAESSFGHVTERSFSAAVDATVVFVAVSFGFNTVGGLNVFGPVVVGPSAFGADLNFSRPDLNLTSPAAIWVVAAVFAVVVVFCVVSPPVFSSPPFGSPMRPRFEGGSSVETVPCSRLSLW